MRYKKKVSKISHYKDKMTKIIYDDCTEIRTPYQPSLTEIDTHIITIEKDWKAMKSRKEILKKIIEITNNPETFIAPGYTIKMLEWVLGEKEELEDDVEETKDE
jgi:hypothetical protein